MVLDAGAQDLDEEGGEDEGVEGEDGGFCHCQHGGGSCCGMLGVEWGCFGWCLTSLSSWCFRRDGLVFIADVYVAVWIT